MEHLKIGQIITLPQQKDAIHIAIAPIEAVHEFRPGQLVQVQDGKAYALGESEKTAVGIVDPFLRCKVNEGEKFWLFLFPGSITSLRHDWTHPNFLNITGNLEAKEWLRNFAESNDVSLADVLFAAEEGYIDNASSSFIVPDEFWIFYKLYTGKEGNVTDYFSCSC